MGGLTLGILLTACFFIFVNPLQKKEFVQQLPSVDTPADSLTNHDPIRSSDSLNVLTPSYKKINSGVKRDSLVSFAKSLLGIPYLYGSIDPARGFDCSGFITYVFSHFNIVVPRSSYEFANLGLIRWNEPLAILVLCVKWSMAFRHLFIAAVARLMVLPLLQWIINFTWKGLFQLMIYYWVSNTV